MVPACMRRGLGGQQMRKIPFVAQLKHLSLTQQGPNHPRTFTAVNKMTDVSGGGPSGQGKTSSQEE